MSGMGKEAGRSWPGPSWVEVFEALCWDGDDLILASEGRDIYRIAAAPGGHRSDLPLTLGHCRRSRGARPRRISSPRRHRDQTRAGAIRTGRYPAEGERLVSGTAGEVVIVGGGAIGLSIAYALAREGVMSTVLDRREMGREASWAGAGMLPPAAERGSAARWPSSAPGVPGSIPSGRRACSKRRAFITAITGREGSTWPSPSTKTTRSGPWPALAGRGDRL